MVSTYVIEEVNFKLNTLCNILRVIQDLKFVHCLSKTRLYENAKKKSSWAVNKI